MSDYLRDRFPLDATDTVRMSGEQGYNLVRYGKPGIIAYVELRPEHAEAFREAVRDMEEAARAEAWDEGEEAGMKNQANWDGWRDTKPPITNPYREEQS